MPALAEAHQPVRRLDRSADYVPDSPVDERRRPPSGKPPLGEHLSDRREHREVLDSRIAIEPGGELADESCNGRQISTGRHLPCVPKPGAEDNSCRFPEFIFDGLALAECKNPISVRGGHDRQLRLAPPLRSVASERSAMTSSPNSRCCLGRIQGRQLRLPSRRRSTRSSKPN